MGWKFQDEQGALFDEETFKIDDDSSNEELIDEELRWTPKLDKMKDHG